MRDDHEGDWGSLIAVRLGGFSADDDHIAESAPGQEALAVDRRGDRLRIASQAARSIGTQHEGCDHSHA